jgi:hypothetical protein
LTPLMGMTGTMKKTVMKRIPLLVINGATVPQLPQRMGWGVCPEPHEKKREPIIKKNILSPQRKKCNSVVNDNAFGLRQSKP